MIIVGLKKIFKYIIFLSIICNLCALPPVCYREIYCTSDLLRVMQMAEIYEDSKTFVDKKMKHDAKKILKAFEILMEKTNKNPSKNDLKNFIEEHFDPEGSEFEPWFPFDWVKTPKFMNLIQDDDYRHWAIYLNAQWKQLGRNIMEEVEANPQQYSQIYVPYPLIVPGGRFREYYYWDSYWTIRGLLYCGMVETVRGMLYNFGKLVESFGFVPNGGRIYYQERSQPPLYIPMFRIFMDSSNDITFLESQIDFLETEYQFWINHRTLDIEKGGQNYRMAFYNTATIGPRPESYKEDINAAGNLSSEEVIDFHNEIKSAAESGWDFSTKWFVNSAGDRSTSFKDIKTRYIIPVELNSILCWNARILGELFKTLGRNVKSKKYHEAADEWVRNIHEVLWNEEKGIWFDYNRIHKKSRPYFYLSNFAPLWTNCYDLSKKDEYAKKAVNYLNSELNKSAHVGGLPTSNINSGQQWDMPNVWPPLMHMVVVGLTNTENQEAMDEAFFWADRWIKSSFAAFKRTKKMFEKYSSEEFGVYGGGGEYNVQDGFGWTNSVIMEFLYMYRDKLHSSVPSMWITDHMKFTSNFLLSHLLIQLLKARW